MGQRFVLIEDEEQFPVKEETCWYWDTERPTPSKSYPYIARQCYRDRNPNDFIRHKEMALLFTDQQEYYAVCLDCRAIYGNMQWSGSTCGSSDWRKRANDFLQEHINLKGWCEFCDPIWGNGGWIK